MSARVIDRMVACHEYRCGVQNVVVAGCEDYFKADLSIGHGAPWFAGGCATTLSHRRLAHRVASGTLFELLSTDILTK